MSLHVYLQDGIGFTTTLAFVDPFEMAIDFRDLDRRHPMKGNPHLSSIDSRKQPTVYVLFTLGLLSRSSQHGAG